VRVSRTTFAYKQVYFGPLSGFNTPTALNGGLTEGRVTESPVTPKLSAQYQLTEDDMFYVTAAKGFRAGGVNSPLSQASCGEGLAAVGLTVNDAPTTYGSDNVWSYEAGAKLRVLDNRVQLNASAFRIDWTDVQLNVSVPGCTQTFTQNAGAARSQGVDFQAQARLFDGLTANVSVAYTDAEYTQTATGPVPRNGSPATPVVIAGDKLPVAPWTVMVGAQYNFAVGGRYDAYVRADYQHASGYFRSFGPGVPSYSPDTREAEATNFVSARVGVNLKGWELSLFANNLFNSRDQLSNGGGRGTCVPVTDAACSVYRRYDPLLTTSYFRPREIGLQASVRY
jgi:outer membrane receptor protein involved in Fe transport